MSSRTNGHREILKKLEELYSDVFEHPGYGDIRVEMRILRRGQKEVILHCGKQYRFVVDFSPERTDRAGAPATAQETETIA